jgi:hypothetical protein
MPYFFVSIVVIAIKLLTESSLQVESPISLTAFYQMLYLPTTAGSFLWFVYTLFLIFLIMPFFNSHKKLSVLLVGALILRYIPIPFTSYFGLIHIKAMLFFFVLGSVLCEWVVIRKIIGKVHIFVTLSAFIGVYILKSHTDVAIILEIIILMLALLGIGATIKVSKILEQTTKIRSILLYVAVCSYTIYLFHTTFEGFAKAVLIKIAKCTFPNVNHTILFMLTTIVVILSGIICPMIIHKIATQNSKILSYLIGEKNISREV